MRQSKRKGILAGAFVVILLLLSGVAWFMNLKRERYSNLGIARANFAHYQSAKIDSLAQADTSRLLGWYHYNQLNYDTALSLLQQIDAPHPHYAEARLCIGVSHLAVGNVAQSIAVLDGIYPVTAQQQTVSWYLGLAYLVQYDERMARFHLAEIARDSTLQPNAAQSILTDLESLWRL